jgi:hypothetical protein
MNRVPVCLLILMVSLAAPVLAEPFVMAQGLAIEPDEELDLTYQVIESYDKTEKVLAGWNGEELRYLITLEKMPPGLVDGEAHLVALEGDIRKLGAANSYQAGRKGNYETAAGLKGNYAEYRFTMRGSEEPSRQVAHFLTDGKSAFLTIATAVQEAVAPGMLDESIAIFRTASFQQGVDEAPPKKNEDILVGKWSGTARTPDGKTVITHVDLNTDLSFTGESTVDGKRVLAFTGIWSLSDKELSWEYVNTRPPMSEESKSDVDTVESYDGKEMVLVSKRTGQKRTFRREE